MSERPLVSVIVAARDSARGVARLLDALTAQTLDPRSVEVILVDDASTDETPEVVGRTRRARLLSTGTRSGAYAARNLGLKAARAGVIAVTDADCLPDPKWLEEGLQALDRSGAELAGGRIHVPVSARPRLAELIDAGRFLDQARSIGELGFAATANLFARHEVFERVGPFDGRFWSGGDAEFSRRATRAGFRLVYAPEAVVRHDPRTSARAVARKAYRVGFGTAQLRRLEAGRESERPSYLRARAYLPRDWSYGKQRLAHHGHASSRARRLQLELGQYALVQVPMLAGQVSADLRRGKRWR